MTTHSTRLIVNIVFVVAVSVSLFLLSRLTSILNPEFAIGLVIAFVIAVLSFFKQDIAAIAIIISMLFSPELKIGSLPRRDIVVRFDDIILIVFFLTWLFKMAYYKNLNLIKITPLNMPILAYIVVALAATWAGVAAGSVTIANSLMYFLKYVEYFMIFFMFSNIIRTEDQLKKFMGAFFLAAAGAALFGIYQIAIGVNRISTPFEGEVGEANTFGGYLLLIIGLTSMIALKAPDIRKKGAVSVATLILLVDMFATLSRAAYLGLAAVAMGCLAFSSRRQRHALALTFFTIIILSPFFMPRRIIDRITSPFEGETEEVAPLLNLNPHGSPYAKVVSTKITLGKWMESPLLGKGVTGVGLVDTQYPRILGEMGILGMLAYIWIVASIFSSFSITMKSLNGYHEDEIWFWRAIVTGFMCGFFGLMLHGIGANTFIIIRIMEPFWFLTAVMVAIPHVLENKYAATKPVPEKKSKRKYALQPWLEKW